MFRRVGIAGVQGTGSECLERAGRGENLRVAPKHREIIKVIRSPMLTATPRASTTSRTTAMPPPVCVAGPMRTSPAGPEPSAKAYVRSVHSKGMHSSTTPVFSNYRTGESRAAGAAGHATRTTRRSGCSRSATSTALYQEASGGFCVRRCLSCSGRVVGVVTSMPSTKTMRPTCRR